MLIYGIMLAEMIYMDKIDIFCGISSLGMPFPKENKNHIGYFDIVKKELSDRGYEVSGVNISRLNKNHTWDLEQNLNQNYSMAQIKNLQIRSIDALREANIVFKLVVPKRFKDTFKVTKEDQDITLKDLFANAQNPIFLYSGGPNDFFTYIQAGPVELINKESRERLPENLDTIVEKCVDNVKNNWPLLYRLNPKVQIMALSFYYSQLFDIIQRVIFLQERLINKDKKYKNRFMEIINLYNNLLRQRCQKYDFVTFVDINFMRDYCAPMDFHPNTLGNEMIAKEILKSLNLDKENNYKKGR